MAKRQKPLPIRTRIKELRQVKASDLRANPLNWRTHPQTQRDTLHEVLVEIGYADALIARELPDGTLELIDGHLRAEMTPDQDVPVLVVDVNEVEARKLLATLDPLVAMAETNREALSNLLSEIQSEKDKVKAVLDGMRQDVEAAIPLMDCEIVGPDRNRRLRVGASRTVISFGRLAAFVDIDSARALADAVTARWGDDWGEKFVAWALQEIKKA